MARAFTSNADLIEYKAILSKAKSRNLTLTDIISYIRLLETK